MSAPPRESRPSPPTRSAPGGPSWTGYLLAPAMLGAVAGGFWIVMQGPRGVLWLILGAGVSIPILWVVISTLWPARADRSCPRCRGEKLVRMDPGSTLGLSCTDCGYRDPSASSWLLAEEEGPLETIVLAERERRRLGERERERIGAGRASDVDSGRDAD